MSLLPDYSNQAERYDEARSASPSVLRPLTDALRGAPGRRVADIGGGTGNYAAALARDGRDPVVIDRSSEMLERVTQAPAWLTALPVGGGSRLDSVSMNEDWRLRIDLHEEGHARALLEGLEAKDLEHDLQASSHDRVIVSRDGPEVFCYAGTREQAEQASKLISSLAVDHGWHADSALTRWHPTAERWEDADKPLPATDAERAAERAELMSRERQDSLAAGGAEWEVRVQCVSHHDALQLADRLEREGLSNVHRWRYLVLGALDEDSANALAERIRREVPTGSTEIVEGTPLAARAAMPPNPFAVFGGLGG